jgi:hypothetical protein
MDFERVYTSDMKKMVKWYEILTANGVEIKLSENPDMDGVPADAATAKAKPAVTKSAAAVNNAPARKINTPRKMA